MRATLSRSGRSAWLDLAAIAIGLTVGAVGPAAGDEQVFEVRIEDGAVAGGAGVLRATHGDAVEIRWTSDTPITLHLHGYDLKVTAAPGAPARMSFQAHATGRFPIEAHGGEGAHRVLLYLEVYPR